MKCKKCDKYVACKEPGIIIWNARTKYLGYTYYCSNCKFEAKSSFSKTLAKLYFILKIKNKYQGCTRATRVDWGYEV